jgi:uncharacterized protein GlcG (DUF336 family)
MGLSLADANQAIAGAMAKAGNIGVKMNIAVASAAFGRPSGDLTERANHPTLVGIAAAEGNHMYFGQGAVPIFRDGNVVGAIGVGGGSAQEDEDCAQAGADCL